MIDYILKACMGGLYFLLALVAVAGATIGVGVWVLLTKYVFGG